MSIAALIGGRLYHVIDQWALYANDPLKIILPPYSGLGVFGGIVTGTLAAWWYARRRGVSFARWADIIAPALFVMQAIGRWGNYFNQELYGPPTTAPWGIPIDCAHRLVIYSCDTLPETTRFHPLFLYESISGLIGAAFLVFLGYRLPVVAATRSTCCSPSSSGTASTRFALETLRADNWTFFGVPTAQIVSLAFIAVGVVGLVLRHRGSRMGDKPPTDPQRATWGALGAAWMTRPIDEPWANVGDRIDDDGVDDESDDDAGDESAMRPSTTKWTRPTPPTRPSPASTEMPRPRRDRTASEPMTGDARPPEATASDPSPPDRPRRRPPPGRISPEAMAAARGGVSEGLAWLGRAPEAKASLLYRAARLLVAVRLLRAVPLPDRDLRPGARPQRWLPAGRRCASGLDGPVRRDARAARRAALLDPGERPVDVHARVGASGSSAGSVACCRSGAAASGSTRTSPRRRRSSMRARSSSRCRRGR